MNQTKYEKIFRQVASEEGRPKADFLTLQTIISDIGDEIKRYHGDRVFIFYNQIDEMWFRLSRKFNMDETAFEQAIHKVMPDFYTKWNAYRMQPRAMHKAISKLRRKGIKHAANRD